VWQDVDQSYAGADRCLQLRIGITRRGRSLKVIAKRAVHQRPDPVRKMLSVEAAQEKRRAADGDRIAHPQRRRRFIP
jgi:hypothetical protein